MYINVENSGKGDNKGSCSALVNYLGKENKDKPIEERELFFSHSEDEVDSYRVRTHIDENKKGLGKDQSKFFMITVNPSEKEQEHIGYDKDKLKQYTREVMEAYAGNFGVGLKGKDLVYYAKLEENRYYKGTDEKVIEGERKMNEIKAGKNMHVHVIVSRKDASNSMKISPMTPHRNTEKGPVTGGFDRTEFKQESEQIFDQMFDYDRAFTETFFYTNTMKNGEREDRLKAIEKREAEEIKRARKEKAKERELARAKTQQRSIGRSR